MSKFTSRTIHKAFTAIEHTEGVGARVRRSIGIIGMFNFTPFVAFDHFYVSPNAGFPDHPHRGQETITYMLKGYMDHEDFTGSAGTLGPGDLQFMTAGRGIVHAEMPRVAPEDSSTSVAEGLQLWVDLPENLKNTEPRYRDLRKEEIPTITPNPKVQIKVISGISHGTESVKDLAYTPVWFFDVTIQPGGRVEQPLPLEFNAFVYILAGEVEVAGKVYPKYTNLFLGSEGDGVVVGVREDAQEAAQVAIIAGQRLEQPIIQHGPFVLSSRDQVIQALRDYDGRKNGFERARGWRSEIGRRMTRHDRS
ncbi:uncharacterized protein SAPINGB_P001280 [Magnusiomyces paraingens]|uniref:Pirin n=1 Tax=Magnusiomyces paraingens TaxID=2606893 RepID=A0A5E8B4W9_9ASCO|nr:uncharacterized protein SAPINGB_P001280 [Saprochaete ingens]VVT46572.1 unnamed protein product [Saprochaete ingens]